MNIWQEQYIYKPRLLYTQSGLTSSTNYHRPTQVNHTYPPGPPHPDLAPLELDQVLGMPLPHLNSRHFRLCRRHASFASNHRWRKAINTVLAQNWLVAGNPKRETELANNSRDLDTSHQKLTDTRAWRPCRSVGWKSHEGYAYRQLGTLRLSIMYILYIRVIMLGRQVRIQIA